MKETVEQPKVKIKDINLTQNRPLDEKDKEFQELLVSVKQQGILQPILLRKSKDSKVAYDLVAGARRLRAAELAGHTEIPAFIRELDDKEAELAKVTENIQRKDLSPLEEAEMYQILLKNNFTAKQISEKTGKNKAYVDSRIKLIDLSPSWREVLLLKVMTLEAALCVSRLHPTTQEELYNDEYGGDKFTAKDAQDPYRRINLDDIESNVNGFLQKISSAKFSTTDKDLYPEAGACTTCPFNSVNMGQLFPDEKNKSGVCTNSNCWEVKTSRTLKKRVELAQEKGILIGRTRYSSNTIDESVLKTLGIESVIDTADLRQVIQPSKPSKKEGESKKDFAARIKEWEKDIASWKAHTEKGDFLQVFMLNGHSEEGKTLWFRKPTQGSAASKKVSTMETLAPTQQAGRIKETLKRGVEIQNNNFTSEVYDTLQKKQVKIIEALETPLNRIEKLILLKNLDEHSHDISKMVAKWPGDAAVDKMINKAARGNIFEEIHPGNETRQGHDTDGDLIHALAKIYIPEDYKLLTAKYAELIAKKTERADQRVKSLKAKPKTNGKAVPGNKVDKQEEIEEED